MLGKVRIIVLNYNGEKILRECLPSLVQAAKRSRYTPAITVLDNRSTDGSLDVLAKNFPGVEVFLASENQVLCSYNEYLAKISEPLVILLNNDLKADPNFIDPLVARFEEDAKLFMVTSKSLSFTGDYESGRCKSSIKYGLFWSASIFPGYERGVGIAGSTMSAGFGAFDRQKFLELGGYDDLYLPGRLEDNDICFRAWRQGWHCFYEPRSVVYHKGAVSFNEAFGSKKTKILGHRNSFLFLWKNIRDPFYLFEHFFLLIPRLLFAVCTGKGELAAGFFRALPLCGQALKRRRQTAGERSVLKDKEIFALVQ
jgi:GT2 family glycosyltransferase